MKKIKFTVVFMVLVMLVGMLVSCGSVTSGVTSDGSSDDSFKGTISLKQFLDSGPKVGFWGSTSLGDPIQTVLFEDGKYYRVDNQGYNSELTLRDISEMSDDELIEFVKEHKCASGLYWLRITMDETGSTVKEENILYRDMDGYQELFDAQTPFRDGDFSGFKKAYEGFGEFALYFRTGENLTITFDSINTEGVLVN